MFKAQTALEEIEAIEKALTTPVDTTGEQVITQSTDEVIIEEVTKVDEEVVPEKVKKKYTNWKKRFQGLKSSHDATVFDLRQELIRKGEDLGNLAATVDNLQGTISELQLKTKSDIFAGVITPEDTEVLGNEAVDSMKKVTQAAVDSAVKPLQDEITANKKRLRKAQEDQVSVEKARAQALFLSKLSNLVEDYAEVNVNPDFLNFMRGVDHSSGYTRERLFKVAEHSGDVGRVAGFFKEFKDTQIKTNTTLEEQITPTNNAVSNAEVTNEKDKPLSMAFIDKFYSDMSKGYYRGKEKLRQEISDRIDIAMSIGNITS